MAKRKPRKRMTLPALVAQFSDETKCHFYLEGLRWPNGVVCPGRLIWDGTREKCGSKKISRIPSRRLFQCLDCGYQFSVRTATIFEDSKLPLWKWFVAVFMMAESKKGISAKQIERMLAVAYKTAWFLCHRIRQAMAIDPGEKKLSGIVEVDETFLGGKGRLDEGHYSKRMDVVMGAVERGGDVRLRAVPDRGRESVQAFVEANVSSDAAAMHTDAYKAYKGAAKKIGVPHGKVNHTRNEWVNGQVHTNTIEGVFSLLDRSIIGAFHKVSTKHLPRYLHEVEWRYNNRLNEYLFRDCILELIGAGRLEYKKLIA